MKPGTLLSNEMRITLLVTSKFSVWFLETLKQADRVEKTPSQYVWLSKRLLDVTGGSISIQFTEAVLVAIENDIQKCRDTRLQFQHLDFQNYGYHILTDICHPSFKTLTEESDMQFDTEAYPLSEAFSRMLGISTEDLPLLHEKFCKDKGRLKDRHEKRWLLRSILDPESREPFHATFLDFVLGFIAPHVKAITDCTKIHFQSFPCIRVVRPGEFSIGPHCDASYGFSQGNVNFYVPLTKIFGTNSLILESNPGLEDWHTIELEYGNLKRFYGSQCSHFTAENTTGQTRISLDFRVILDEHWHKDHDHFCSTPGYYSSCEYILKTENTEKADLYNTISYMPEVGEHSTKFGTSLPGRWVLSEDILEPDWRVGFPFEKINVVKHTDKPTTV